MDKKKNIINLLIIILAFILFISWHQRYIHVTVNSSLNPNKSLKVYLITQDKSSEFYHTLNQGASDMADSLGITYKWTAPVKKNNEEQIAFVNKAVQDGVNLILLAANDPIAISSAIEDAKANGVKIIYVDSPAYEEAVTTLATDNYRAGVIAGENMIKQLVSLGITNGKIGVISNNEVITSVLDRDRGFRNTITKDGRYTLLNTVYDNGDIKTAFLEASDLMDQNKDLVGIFATNEVSTTGLGNAIKEKKKKLNSIGFDKTNEILKLLKDGYLDEIIVQNPYTMGYLGMAEAYAAIRGLKTGPAFFNTGVSIINKPD